MTGLELLTLTAVCLAGAASPGPSLVVILGATVNGSRRAGLSAAWAHALGVALYAVLTVIGIGAVIAADARIFLGLQLGGAAYLLYLAAKLWLNAHATDLSTAVKAKSPVSAATAGFAIAFLNPKLAVFMLALFSQFVRPGDTLATQLELVAVAGLVDGLWYSVVAMVFTQSRWLNALRRQAHRIDLVFAFLLAIVAAAIIVRSALAFLQ